MKKIQLLDQITIDKIAAGEVIERPASIVKELAENAIDAGATAIIIEIKEGGIAFIRITDNGCGIEREDVASAFLRHSTSKIRSADDLEDIGSLGFRGEALSSIAAVSQVEVVTRTKGEICGSAYRIEGGKEISLSEIGAPDGTTFLVRQLFYNTPARRKFLKTPVTEASHIAEVVVRLSLSHPEISFQFINNGQVKIHTSGNGNLKDVIYHIYGREIAGHLLEVDRSLCGIQVFGYVGEPVISRGNRNFENYFINARYIKNNIISKAIEDAYRDFTMQHKYPFTVLHLKMEGRELDVNVHPAKMEVRFKNQQEVYNAVCEIIRGTLQEAELIPKVSFPQTTKDDKKQSAICDETIKKQSEYDEKQSTVGNNASRDLDYFMKKMRERVAAYHRQNPPGYVKSEDKSPSAPVWADKIQETLSYPGASGDKKDKSSRQLHLFEDQLLTKEAAPEHQLIGQIFDTFWLVEFKDNLYIIDQHAAHERVLYEKTLREMQNRTHTSQYVNPPIILELSMQEAELLETYMEHFTKIGFEIESFGQEAYAVRAVPGNLFSIAKKDLLTEMIDSLADEIYTGLAPNLVDEKIASMSCKAAVKGNMKLSMTEAKALIKELLSLDNPYHCPHGRPTIIAVSRRELEKRFKRIV